MPDLSGKLGFTSADKGASRNPIASGCKLWQNKGLMPQRPPLKISARQVAGITVLDLTGDITLFNSPEIRKALIDELKDRRVPHLTLNMLAGANAGSSRATPTAQPLQTSPDLRSRFALT